MRPVETHVTCDHGRRGTKVAIRPFRSDLGWFLSPRGPVRTGLRRPRSTADTPGAGEIGPVSTFRTIRRAGWLLHSCPVSDILPPSARNGNPAARWGRKATGPIGQA